LRGSSIHNAFFWAIDRSQDATIMHDWFSKAGQGLGTEYRYNFGGGSDGAISSYLLNEHAGSYTQADGTPAPATRSYKITGGANQLLPFGFRARGQINYFSSVVTNQTFDTNVLSTTNSQRSFGGNIVGAFNNYSVNATLNHSEYFYNSTDSTISGNWPQLNVSRNERPLFGSDVYFSASGEYARLLQESKSQVPDANGVPHLVDSDLGLTRLDIRPQIRYPFKKWQWFTINSSVMARETYYTRSYDVNALDPNTNQQCVPGNGTCPIIGQGLNRRYFMLQAQRLGPLFSRIFDTPDNGYAEKFKHSIEPYVNVQYISPIDNFDQIVRGNDTVVGGVQYNYGINNRFYAKRRGAPGQPSLSREIFDVELTQTYYTNQTASQYDPRYTSSLNTPPQSNFSPIALNVRGMPTNDINATVHAEFDSRYHSLRTVSANGTYAWTGRVQTTVGWSKQGVIPQLGFSIPSEFMTVTSNVHTKDNRIGTLYSFNYDLVNSYFLQQRISAFYNSQCCGLAMEYQTVNFGNSSSALAPPDHRFFLSFTLAGLGNFSPFNGALSGVPR
jgi:lipopolysaccharide assembly outer membrane protein LptD (OstA)